MNSFDVSFLSDKDQFDALLYEYIDGKASFRTPKTRSEICIFIKHFHRWWLCHGQLNLTDETLLVWMLYGLKRAKVTTVATKVIVLKHFFSFLVDRKLLPVNPLSRLRKGYRTIGYRGIVRELKRTGSISAVIALADYPFSGQLGCSCQDYLDYLAALGKRCDNERYCISSFERFLRHNKITSWSQVDRDVIEAWLRERKALSAYQRRSILLVLEGLFQFIINTGEVVKSPVPQPGPHRRRSLPPRIFTVEEVRGILNETAKLPDRRLMPFRGQTYRMFFLTLYTLGLRANEALNLRLNDLDFTQRSLTIGQTKFYKGRVLPFGPRYEAALCSYINAHPLLRGVGQDAFLFPTDSQRTLHLVYESALKTLQLIVNRLALVTPPETRQPGLHSFRHSFAVHSMEKWLRQGVDVQTKLPLLSAFLGHVDAAATQVYLTMTPKRLELIGKRFENAVGKGVV